MRGRGAVEKRDCQDEQASDRDGGAGTGDTTAITPRSIHEEAPESVLLLGWAGAAHGDPARLCRVDVFDAQIGLPACRRCAGR